MCLLDTVDGALMMALYTSTSFAKDQIAILYYSIVLTVITVVVAIVIGVIQLLTLVLNVSEPSGRFWDGVAVAGDNYDIIGKCPNETRKFFLCNFLTMTVRWSNMLLFCCLRRPERNSVQALAPTDRQSKTEPPATPVAAGG